MIKIGDKVTGTIKGIQPYGIFLSLPNDAQGLIHISEAKSGFVGNLTDLFQLGEKQTALVIDIDEYSKQVSLSLRALEELTSLQRNTGKHYWTNRKIHQGFKPLAKEINDFVHEALKKYKNA